MSKSIVERIRREQRARQATSAEAPALATAPAAAGVHPEVAFIEAFLQRFSADIVPLVSRSLSEELRSALNPIYEDIRGSIKDTLDATTSELNRGIAALQQQTAIHESSRLQRPIDVDSDLIAREVTEFVDRVATRGPDERWDGSADTDLEIPIAELKSELERIMSDPSSLSARDPESDDHDIVTGEQDTMMLDDDAADSKEWLSSEGVFAGTDEDSDKSVTESFDVVEPEPSGELLTESLHDEEALADLSDLEAELADLEALGESAIDESVSELLDASSEDVVADHEIDAEIDDDVEALADGELTEGLTEDLARNGAENVTDGLASETGDRGGDIGIDDGTSDDEIAMNDGEITLDDDEFAIDAATLEELASAGQAADKSEPSSENSAESVEESAVEPREEKALESAFSSDEVDSEDSPPATVPTHEDFDSLLAKVDENYHNLVEKIEYVEVLVSANFESMIARLEGTITASLEKLASGAGGGS